MEVAIMIEGQMGLNWQRWMAISGLVESLGFSGLYRSDHFTNASPPDEDSLEMIVSLTQLAVETSSIKFGCMVAPASFRDPVQLARQATAINSLSSGRMVLGMGAGWQSREHEVFGYELGDVATRMSRLEEALTVVDLLLGSDEAVDFDGRFYKLRGAVMLPRPGHEGRPQLLVGGNGMSRTLPLAARFADVWNAISLNHFEFRERTRLLDELATAAGRSVPPKKTMMCPVFFARDEARLEDTYTPYRKNPRLADLPAAEIATRIRQGGGVAGTPGDVADGLLALKEAGVEEVMLQWFGLDDLEGLTDLAEVIEGIEGVG